VRLQSNCRSLKWGMRFKRSANRRAFIERNAIALLSNHRHPMDKASARWLGNSSPADAVRGSALWNVNHVNEDYDPRFLDDLAACVARTCA